MTKAQQLFTVIKMEELPEKDLKLSTGKFEIEFVLVECIDYFRDEYMLLNGYQLVRIIRGAGGASAEQLQQ